jgi:hypothetical protein
MPGPDPVSASPTAHPALRACVARAGVSEDRLDFRWLVEGETFLCAWGGRHDEKQVLGAMSGEGVDWERQRVLARTLALWSTAPPTTEHLVDGLARVHGLEAAWNAHHGAPPAVGPPVRTPGRVVFFASTDDEDLVCYRFVVTLGADPGVDATAL